MIENSIVESLETLNNTTFLLKTHSPSIASSASPGQFCNIKVTDSGFPLLRRPFSICDIEGESVFYLFDIHGQGTMILSGKKRGDRLEILGPLGKGFSTEGDYDTSVIVAGGVGCAPFPFLIRKFDKNKKMLCYLGGRSKEQLVKYGLSNLHIATDDGSVGFHGTVIDLLKSEADYLEGRRIRIYGCGPNPMLKALQTFADESGIDCQISVESVMACGFGICQGCPIEASGGERYLLVCKDGPVFHSKEVRL